MRNSKTYKTAFFSLLLAAALILSYLESLLSGFIPVPGVKIGISNIATVYVLYEYGFPQALGFGVLKALLASAFTGRVSSVAFSLTGIVLSVLVMALLKKTGKFSLLGVNVSGAIFHIAGQISAASIILQTKGVWLFLPWLAIIAVCCGIITYIILRRLFTITAKINNKNTIPPEKKNTE